jgi:hypothetical protein
MSLIRECTNSKITFRIRALLFNSQPLILRFWIRTHHPKIRHLILSQIRGIGKEFRKGGASKRKRRLSSRMYSSPSLLQIKRLPPFHRADKEKMKQ